MKFKKDIINSEFIYLQKMPAVICNLPDGQIWVINKNFYESNENTRSLIIDKLYENIHFYVSNSSKICINKLLPSSA